MEAKQNRSEVPEWKKKEVEKIRKLAESYSTIGIINLENLPTKQLQAIKKKLGDKILIKITKKRFIKFAFDSSAQERLKKFSKHVTGAPGLLFSKLGAFELFKLLKESRRSAPIKPGQIAPEDIWIQSGPTPFTPGPVISDFNKLGIKTSVESGKIAISKDSIVIKKGEKASFEAASILSKLGIEPMKIGINLTYVLENEDIYPAEILDIDVNAYLKNIRKAHSDAFALSVELGIINKETITHLIKKAFNEAKSLAIEQGILTSETIGNMLLKTEAQAKALEKAISK